MMSNRLLLVSILSAALCFLASPTGAQTASSAAQGSPNSFQQLVMDIQGMLTELGYRPGGVDGSVGQRTREAIRRYQSNTGLTVDGHPSESLRQHLRVTTGAAAPGNATESRAGGQAAGEKSKRKAAWQGRTVADSLLRIAPSGASASKQRLAKGTELEVIRRQGAWLEVRVKNGGSEGWVKQSSVRAATEAAAAPSKKKSGGFFANLSRGISRLLGGSSDAPRDHGNVTVGIRGLAAEDLAATIPDPGEV
ncbi:MAG: peptidoglycan-binding protein, partial [Gammaproteobacteria bacterium]|nr:peptidoglycan-binding protein [Gammaproteobacteria bacterium]